jgi:predicted TIM-barrel fold metal-dependent hydrolase
MKGFDQMSEFSRRKFIISAAGAALGWPVGRALAEAAASADTPWTGEKIVDCHFHERASEASMIAHLDGCGVSSGLMLAFGDSLARMPELRRNHPGRFLGWGRGVGFGGGKGAASSPSAPSPFDMARMVTAEASKEAVAELVRLKQSGWKGFAESGVSGDVDSPEMHRLFALASELDVPIMMHFQKAGIGGQPARAGRGFSHIEPMLKQYPKAKLIGHASDFWGHIDAKYTDGGAYLTGKVTPGGLIDRLLADYPNLYGDLGAPSCLIQIGRDPEFTSGFLKRHRQKLMFGSDCGCADGRGGDGPIPQGGSRTDGAPVAGATQKPGEVVDSSNASALQMRMAAMGGLGGKCIARELLHIAWKSLDREEFRDIAWNNAVRVYKLDV